MAKCVRAIPAVINRRTAMPVNAQRKRRVAAYARVSSDMEEQLTSYAAQIDYYTHYIKGRDDWEFAGMYSDEGITGTSTKHREGFNNMVADALSGKIDLIITKSVSRFARNTVDSLTTIRKLKAQNVECYFEKENIWTFDGKGELLLTIMSSLAQEESRSISENCTWGQRKRLADGKVSVGYSTFLGYDRGPNGGMVVNPEQAKVVRRIYAMFLSGLTATSICRILTKDGIPTPGGKTLWRPAVVKSILTNEKYKGDALLQKGFTVDFLTKKFKKNEGEVPQYYVEDDHEAIVSKEIFDAVQREFERRKKIGQYSGVSMMATKIVCGDCGGYYGSKVWHSTDKYRKRIYRCNHKYDEGHKKCETPTLTEEEVKGLFVKAGNRLLKRRDELVEKLSQLVGIITQNEDLEENAGKVRAKMGRLVEEMNEAVVENAHVAADQDEYQQRYASLQKTYEKGKGEYERLTKEISDRKSRARMLEMFLSDLKKQDKVLTFDERLWASLLDGITAYRKDKIVFRFKDGSEVSVGL